MIFSPVHKGLIKRERERKREGEIERGSSKPEKIKGKLNYISFHQIS